MFKEVSRILFLGGLTIFGAITASVLTYLFLPTPDVGEIDKGLFLSIQMISTILIFLIPSAVFLYNYRDTIADDNKITSFKFSTLVVVLLLITFARPLVSWIDSLMSFEIEFLSTEIEYLKQMAKKINDQVILLAYSETPIQLMFRLLVLAFVPALAEELFFRASLQNIIIKSTGKVHVSIVVASLIFALIHMNVVNFIAIFILGLILGYIYYFTKNIIYPIIAHFVNNGSLVLMMYKNEDIAYGESFEVSFSILFISIIITSFTLYYLANLKRFENM